MIQLVCESCGGALVLNYNRTVATCEYCNREYLVNHEDDSEFDIIPAINEEEEQERAVLHTKQFKTSAGKTITLHYMYEQQGTVSDMYITEQNVIYQFHREHKDMAQSYVSNCSKIQYVDSRMESKMKYYLPEVVGTYELSDESVIVAIKKLKWTYPLNLIGELDQRHMAWIVSRLENIACLLEYNHLYIREIDYDDLFIDPKNHQILLYGGWYKAGESSINGFLQDIRKVAAYVVHNESPVDVPKELQPALRHFIDSKPLESATKDFEWWDTCLTNAFGERKFIKLEIKETDVYK